MIQRPRVLVVDDDPVFLRLIATIARTRCLVRTADSGADAIISISHFMPDLIVTDLEMPNWDGLKLLESIRSNTKTELIPVIMLTGNGVKENIQKAAALGISGYILKTSFQPNDFLTMISFALQRNDMIRLA